MKSEFSEFSYGFALTHNLLHLSPSIQVAPQFPSLVQEGGIGYDVQLGYPTLPTFLQFKLSDYLTRRPAKYWNHYHEPYFRFDISSLVVSNQHNLLKDLANRGELVYYVAPLFWETTEFNRAFRTNQISARSIWVHVGRLPRLTDYEPHHVTFIGPKDPAWHTEQWNLGGTLVEGDFSWQQAYENIEVRFERKELRPVTRDYLYELRQMLAGILNVSVADGFQTMDDQADFSSMLRETDYLLTTFFGLELILLWPTLPSQG